MWSKFTSALKPRQAPEEPPNDVLHKVYEQHPNLSVFHPNDAASSPIQPSPPPSPTRSSKRSVLKRLSRQPLKDDIDGAKTGSLKMPGLPKKVRPQLNFNTVGSGSQLSHSSKSTDPPMPSPNLARSNSMDMLASSQDPYRPPSRSSIDVLRSPSLDMLRNEQPPRSSQETQRPVLTLDPHMPPTPGLNDRMGSVRSILREPNTPGTGQNVRFFSRDAYKVLSPDQSVEQSGEPSENNNNIYAPPPPPKDTPLSFLDALNQTSPESTSTPAHARHGKSNSKSSRPTVVDLFSPLKDTTPLPGNDADGSEMSLASPVARNASSDMFDLSQPLDLRFDPPGLNFDVNAPIFDQSLDMESSFNHSTDSKHGLGFAKPSKFTSTPPRLKNEPEEENESANLQVPLPPLTAVDETIFHAKEVPQRMPTPLHDRSQSFTLGQTVFYSMSDNTRGGSASNTPGNLLKDSSSSMDSPSVRNSIPPSSKSRARAISDSMLQNMLRGSPKLPPPEADINDDRSEEVQLYASPPVDEPDPFSAHASTYYTPQVMIPTTPPKTTSHHARKTSKEENLIVSLQTQLAFQTELCQQYETDLRARDELVEILGKKLAEAEKEDGMRRGTMKSWKKKLKELERTCRMMEEELDSSRQMSMERSVMDEASGEALRMLHRQIAALEREKAEQVSRENMLKDELETLEMVVKEKSEDVVQLREMLWNRDQSERELSQGIRDVKAQVDEMGNVSMAYIDEDELKRLREEKERVIEEKESRHRVVEVTWQQEKEELLVNLEGMQAERASWEEAIEKAKQQLKSRDEEYDMLKSELESQWSHTESMSSKIEELEKQKLQVEQERDDLRHHVDDLENRISEMEAGWTDSENRKNELEAEVQNLWNLKEALEKDRDQIDYDLQQEQDRAETMVQERDDRIAQLEQEIQFNNESNARLQENNRKRDQEIDEYRTRVVDSEGEAENLREEINGLKREYNRLLEEQSRWSRESSSQGAELKASLENLVKQKAETDVELATSRDQVAALKDEVERLRRQVHGLQQKSADSEVKIAQLEKQKQEAKQDILNFNIALDSKQQELEMIKRTHGVRGTGGMTPVQSSKSTISRRDSAVFNSTPVSRPSSVISDNGVDGLVTKKTHERRVSSERPSSSASVSRPSTALSKSSRANSSAVKIGTMGPPANPTKPRVAISGTPTPTAKGLGRSNSAKPVSSVRDVVSPTGTPLPQRRVSSAVVALEQRAAASTSSSIRASAGRSSRVTSPISRVQELDEKENDGESVGMVSSARRRVLVPT